MGRWSFSNRTEADHLKKIEISWLKKNGYLEGWKSGTITWTHGWSGNKSSIGLDVCISDDEQFARFHYTQTDRDTGEKKDFSYKIPLTTTPCRYGGKRYWFTCPFFKNGVYCGRRVGVVYKEGDYFACRHCYNLTYESRNVSGRMKAFGRIISIPELESLEKEIKRTHYAGKPTKKYLRYIQKQNRAYASLDASLKILEGKTRKYV